MAENKKSFIMYTEWRELFQELPDEKVKALMNWFFDYVNDLNPECKDPYLKPVVSLIKPILKRDLMKWNQQRKQRSEAGKASVKKRQRALTSVNEIQRASTVNVNVNVILDEYKAFMVDISESPTYIEALYRLHGVRQGAISKLLKNFRDHLITQNTPKKTLSEFKKHFNNWLQTENDRNRLDKYKLKGRGAI